MHSIKTFGLGLGLVALLAGCAHSRLVQQSTIKSDSSRVVEKEKTVESDSVSYKESVNEKTLHGSRVDVVLSNSESIKNALEALPKGVSDTIYVTDPTNQTRLKFYLDQNKQLHAQAETADRKYNEITIEKNRAVKILTSQLSEKDREISQLRDQVREHEDSWLAKAGRFIKDSVWTVLLIVSLATVLYLVWKFKPKLV